MQHLPGRASGNGFFRIEPVAQQRMPDMGHVHTDLMRPAGEDAHPHKGRAPVCGGPEPPETGFGGPPPCGHGHAGFDDRMTAHGRGNDAPRSGHARHQRQIFLVHAGWGADVVFECSGHPSAYADLWKIGAPGNRTVLVGIPVDPVPVDVTEVQARETTIESVFRYANVYQRAIDLVAAGKIDLTPFITQTFDMDHAVDAFDRVAEGRPGDVKIQITVG